MKTTLYFVISFFVVFFFACKKNEAIVYPDPPAGYSLSYPDSFYVAGTSSYKVSPVIPLQGKYKAFPDNLSINNTTGEITVKVNDKDGEHPQTGLRYRITYTAPNNQVYETYFVLGGVNYQDKIFYKSQNPLVKPIFNARLGDVSPGGTFSAKDDDLKIDPVTGIIDLKATQESHYFGKNPKNAAWDVAEITYTAPNNTKHEMEVVLYYYTSVNVIPENVSGAMREHQNLLLGIPPENIPVTNFEIDRDIKNIVFANKPRPPCIILIAQ